MKSIRILTSLRQDPSIVGFEITERFLVNKIESLGQMLPEIDDQASMALELNHKVIHEYILQNCKEQTMAFRKSFKLKGNTPKVKKKQ